MGAFKTTDSFDLGDIFTQGFHRRRIYLSYLPSLCLARRPDPNYQRTQTKITQYFFLLLEKKRQQFRYEKDPH